MQTIITYVVVRDGEEEAWDGALRERVAAAAGQPGFVAVQVAAPADEPQRRVIIGTWESREHWEAWHEDEGFQRTREELEVVDETTTDSAWYEVLTVAEHR
jgi:heme-degrading monooxygenase HmoA